MLFRLPREVRPPIRGQYTHDAMALEDRLNGPLAKAEHLPSAVRDQLFRIERKPHLSGVLRNYKRNRQRPFPSKNMLRREFRQFLSI
jgi:hypothetical protein